MLRDVWAAPNADSCARRLSALCFPRRRPGPRRRLHTLGCGRRRDGLCGLDGLTLRVLVLVLWNPAIGGGCGDLWAGYAGCVVCRWGARDR